jgi:hypothetical protein
MSLNIKPDKNVTILGTVMLDPADAGLYPDNKF